MKILEIIDTKQQYFKANKPFAADITDRELRKNSGERGELKPNSRSQGSYGSVRLHKTDPHLVRKRNLRPKAILASDGYYAFITDLIKYYEVHGPNPYLPRIFNINHVEDSDGKKLYTADIEKLFEFGSLNNKELKSIFHRIYGKEYPAPSSKDSAAQNGEMASIMLDSFRKAAENNDFTFYYYPNNPLVISDEQLIKALKFIRSLGSEGYQIDIRFPNMMIRRGSYGAQIVFSDPIGD